MCTVTSWPMWEQFTDIVERAYCWEVLPICTELFKRKTIQFCIKILLKTTYHITKTISQSLNHFSFLLCFLKHLHNTPLEEQNLVWVVYFIMSLNMSSSAMFERALDVSFRSQRREKTAIPLAWLYNNQERMFFQCRLCDVAHHLGSLGFCFHRPCQRCSEKESRFSPFQGRETDQSVMLRCGLVFVIIWDLIIKQLLYLI